MNQEKDFSSRAQDLLNRPVHLQTDSQLNYYVELDQTDNILTARFPASSGSENSLQNLFNEVVCRLGIGKKLEKIAAISFREVENFLRDENHLPAFNVTATEITTLEKSFSFAKFAFLSAGFLARTTANFNPGGTLAEKNAAFSQLIHLFNKVFFSKHGIEFVLFDESVLYLKCPIDCWSADDLNTFFTSLFSALRIDEEIKVVAVQ